MNNTLISAIRIGFIAGALFFALASDVFAAPTLTPATVMTVSETTATVSAKVIAPPFEKATVWFEWGDSPSASTAIGLRTIFESGFFEAGLHDLRPNTTYYFRAVAMQGGVTVSSPTTSFTTKGPVANTVIKIPPPTTTVVHDTKTVVVTAPATTTAAPVTTSVSKTTTSNQGASVIGAGGVLPGTLIGWIALLISIFTALLIILMILEASEKRKKKPVVVFQEGNEDETA